MGKHLCYSHQHLSIKACRRQDEHPALRTVQARLPQLLLMGQNTERTHHNRARAELVQGHAMRFISCRIHPQLG